MRRKKIRTQTSTIYSVVRLVPIKHTKSYTPPPYWNFVEGGVYAPNFGFSQLFLLISEI